MPFTVDVEAKGYTRKTQDVDGVPPGRHSISIYLEVSNEVTFNVDFYAIDSQNHRLTNVKVIVDGDMKATGTSEGVTRFILLEGEHAVSFEGPGYYVWSNFPYEVKFTSYSAIVEIGGNAKFTAIVDQSLLKVGVPPPPPTDPWAWLLLYGPYIIVGSLAVGVGGYFLSSTAKVVEAVKH